MQLNTRFSFVYTTEYIIDSILCILFFNHSGSTIVLDVIVNLFEFVVSLYIIVIRTCLKTYVSIDTHTYRYSQVL